MSDLDRCPRIDGQCPSIDGRRALFERRLSGPFGRLGRPLLLHAPAVSTDSGRRVVVGRRYYRPLAARCCPCWLTTQRAVPGLTHFAQAQTCTCGAVFGSHTTPVQLEIRNGSTRSVESS